MDGQGTGVLFGIRKSLITAGKLCLKLLLQKLESGMKDSIERLLWCQLHGVEHTLFLLFAGSSDPFSLTTISLEFNRIDIQHPANFMSG